MGIRVSEEDEYMGLDVSLHGEPVYSSDQLESLPRDS